MKKYIAMSMVAAFVVSNVSAADLKNVPMAKTYPMDTVASTVAKVATPVVKSVAKAPMKVAVATQAVNYDAKIEKLEKSIKKLNKKLNAVKAHDAKDNIKWSVDFRTSLDSIEYKTAEGLTHKNDAIFSNRLWLNMAYAPSDNMIFKGQLSYNKAYGASPKGAFGLDQRGNSHSFDTFDWVTNETLTNDSIKLKEAYWLYMSDSLFGSGIDWTASFGRRPSTNGFLVSLRDNDKPASPMGHMINMEFDGASFKFGLEKVTGVSGMYWKLCLGRGLTNARARFNMDTGLASSGDYSEDKSTMENVDLAGFIFVPYDNGQYKIMSTYYRGFNVPGFVMADANMFTNPEGNSGMVTSDMNLNQNVSLRNLGDMDGAALSLKVDGIGDGISDFLDNTVFFASFGWSKSMPDNEIASMSTALSQGVAAAGGVDNMMAGMNQQVGAGVAQAMAGGMSQEDAVALVMSGMEASMAGIEGMLGSNDDETGTSYWLGLQWPCLLVDDAKFGAEFNHGSKYWRPFTYGEDTLVGSKLAVRGDAYEFYWSKKLMKSFTMQIRYTKIDYEYTGSQGFFGGSGTPMTMDEAKAFGMDPIEEAQDIRLSFRYRF
ncbi:MAG TPA: DUF3373 family protein [Campylobacterales bacterium]|nr:DUF3373 family protein [Campylobacterales bacterium]